MSFIEKIAPYAIKYMEQEGILASLTIAQAILESDYGKSGLSIEANNLFGMKYSASWKGGKYDKKTKEYSGGKWIEIVASFCKFKDLEECIRYRSTVFLKSSRYSPIWNVTDYKIACQKIYECGYATDPKYPQKLIKVIEDNQLYKFDKEDKKMPTYVVSSGHSNIVRGASKHLDEVNEARKVVDKVGQLLKQAGSTAHVFHDNTSRTQNINLQTIVNYHNSKIRDIDISVHFNAGGGHGVEVLYFDAKDLASKVSSAIAKASGLKDRGPKQRKDLYFLRNTTKPAILLEICFVDSLTDTATYKAKFNQICEAIVEALTGKKVSSTPTPTPAPKPTPKPVTPPTPKTPAQSVEKEAEEVKLNDTGRKAIISLIQKAVADGTFTSKHENVEKYDDGELLSYLSAYIDRKMK